MLHGISIHGRTDEMSGATQVIRAYFFKLGLSSEIADLYLALYAYGDQTISELARHSGVERTRVYRLMDELQSANLIEVEVKYKRKILRAAPIANLQILLSKKEQELHDLYKGLGDLETTLAQGGRSTSATKIQAYQGTEGLKQMFWNQTRGTGENLSILHETVQIRTDRAFFERWVQAFNKKGLQSRSVFGDNFVKNQQTWYKKHTNERLSGWQGRYIPEGIFPITHSVVIYNDVTSYYNWKDGVMFGVEIYNQQIADAQRQFFEILWNQGVHIDDLKDVKGQLPTDK